MTYSNSETGENYTGIWEVNCTGGQDNSSQLIASLTHDVTGEIKQIIWDSFSTTKKKICSNSSEKEGFYNYTLIRQ